MKKRIKLMEGKSFKEERRRGRRKKVVQKGIFASLVRGKNRKQGLRTRTSDTGHVEI